MTKNQIEYWRSQYLKKHEERMDRETKRSNKAREHEERRSNIARERENIRSNVARERLQQQANAINLHLGLRSQRETERRNRAIEEMQAISTEAERRRVEVSQLQAEYNREVGLANAGASYAAVAENTRANMAREAEINRANLINESISQYQAETGRLNSTASLLQAGAAGQRAATGEKQLNFDVDKWNSTLRPQAESQTELNTQRAAHEEAQTKLETYNAYSNRLNVFGNLLGNVGRAAGASKGGKLYAN